MAQGWRTSWHLAREWMRERWPFLLGCALVPPSVLGLTFHEPLTATLGILGIVVSVVLLIVDSRTYRERRRDLVLEETNWPYGRARVPLSHPGARLVRLRDEHVLLDPALDARLDATPVSLRVRPGQFAIDQELRGYRACVLRDRRGTVRFDGACVRLGTDVTGELLDRPAADRGAEVQLVGYFDLLSSNYLASYAVRSRKTGKPLLRGIDLVLDQHNRVRPLSDSRLANVIGVSTLAITRDRHLVTGIQAPGNNSSARLRAPAGSGSVDHRDLPGVHTLQELVIRAMERELGEEINLEGVGRATRITGYNRWLEKGAKPEFVGITVLDSGAREVRDRPIRRDERDLVASVETHEIDPAGVLLVRNQLRGVPDDVLRGASVPLLIALRTFAVAIANEPELFDRLLDLARQGRQAVQPPPR